MKNLLVVFLFPICAYGQKDTTVTDSTGLISINQILRADKYLESNMTSIKDYKLVMSVLNQLLQEAITERKKKIK